MGLYSSERSVLRRTAAIVKSFSFYHSEKKNRRKPQIIPSNPASLFSFPCCCGCVRSWGSPPCPPSGSASRVSVLSLQAAAYTSFCRVWLKHFHLVWFWPACLRKVVWLLGSWGGICPPRAPGCLARGCRSCLVAVTSCVPYFSNI